MGRRIKKVVPLSGSLVVDCTIVQLHDWKVIARPMPEPPFGTEIQQENPFAQPGGMPPVSVMRISFPRRRRAERQIAAAGHRLHGVDHHVQYRLL